MRQVIAAALLSVCALWTSTSAAAGSGHWYCTADGIKSWTSDGGATDASGWTYSGDKSVYKDGGHCTKK